MPKQPISGITSFNEMAFPSVHGSRGASLGLAGSKASEIPSPDPWPQWHWGVLWSLPDSQHRSGDCYGNFETGRKGGGAPRTFLSASLKPLSCLCKFTHPSWAVFKCCLSVCCGCGCWWGNWALMPAQCLLVTQGHFGDLSRKSGGFKATPCCYHQKPNND